MIYRLVFFFLSLVAFLSENRLLSKLALVEKIDDFCADLSPSFESICVHMVEKFDDKDAKNDNFLNQSEFRKKSNEFRIITLEYNPNLGMFAAANQVLSQLYLFEIKHSPQVVGLEIDFGKNGLYYDPSCGPNWWSYYFEPISLGEKENATIVYPTKGQYLEGWRERRMMTKEIAAEIVKKYVHIKEPIEQKIDEFADRFFLDNFMIGVHYRGTDKSKEAPKIEYETVFDEIDKYIPEEKPYSIFIATDEAAFLEEAKIRYQDQVVALEAHRSDGGELGVHFQNKNNYALGVEALMDACLLSKCNLLIRTSSNLSLWSTYFNPELPSVLLSQRYLPTFEPE